MLFYLADKAIEDLYKWSRASKIWQDFLRKLSSQSDKRSSAGWDEIHEGYHLLGHSIPMIGYCKFYTHVFCIH